MSRSSTKHTKQSKLKKASQTTESDQEFRAVHQDWENPIGTEGFEFLAFASLDPAKLAKQFTSLGFIATAKHPSKDIVLYQQGNLRFLLNSDPTGYAREFADTHGPCAYAMGFRVTKADSAYAKLIANKAEQFDCSDDTTGMQLPAIAGIGGSILYIVDHDDYLAHFIPIVDELDTTGVGLTYLDHVTHNVFRGNMDKWAEFYERLFNFREIRYFDIEGKLTGLKSRAMTSPCGNIRIPINESSDDKSQIEEYLREYHGEGIQHIAFGTDNIYHSVASLHAKGIGFLTIPDTYYEAVDKRVEGHKENITELKKHRILIDGAPTKEQGLLLQIFTENMLGPIFFEIIQRKGNEGFGEGNFKALFESIELDQVRRGVL